MKQENGYWIDENNNSWDCDLYSEDQAKAHSESLVKCNNMRNSSRCSGCSRCSYCSYCSDCSYCSRCSHCSDCSDWGKSPQCYVTDFIGSRNAQTRFFWNKEKTQVVCGCFNGTLEEFEAKVNSSYPDDCEHGKAYRAEIAKMKFLAGIEQNLGKDEA